MTRTRSKNKPTPIVNKPCPYNEGISCHWALAARYLIREGFTLPYSKCVDCAYLPEDIQKRVDDERDLRARFTPTEEQKKDPWISFVSEEELYGDRDKK